MHRSKLVAFLGNYDHWRALPVVGYDGEAVYLYLDHRIPIERRMAAIRETKARHGCLLVERVVVDAPPDDCDGNVHDYAMIQQVGGSLLGAQCRRCDHLEILGPSLPFVELGHAAV